MVIVCSTYIRGVVLARQVPVATTVYLVESGFPYALGVQNSKRASVSSPPLVLLHALNIILRQALNYEGRCSTLHSLRRGRFKVVLPLTEKRERSSLQLTFNLDGPQSNVEVQADLTVCHMFSGQHPQLYRLVPLDQIYNLLRFFF